MRRTILISLALLALGCDEDPGLDAGAPRDSGADDGGQADDAGAPMDAGEPTDAGETPADAGADMDAGPGDSGCPRVDAPADRPRFVVVSHPFDENGMQTDVYEVLALDAVGALSRPSRRFSMGRSTRGTIEFTRDGQVGLVAQADGTVGVFTLDAAGVPTVVHARFSGPFYAASVVMDPSGESAWILDAQFRETGGGVYHVDIGCDGSLSGARLVAPGRLPYGMAFRGDGAAVLVSRDVLGVPLGADLHLLDLAGPSVTASADVFVEPDWIVAGFALTANEGHAILGDNASFSPTGNRLGVAEVSASGLRGVQVIPNVEDPVSIVASPFDDRVLVVSGFGNAIFELDYDGSASAPLSNRREPTYATRGPTLPGSAVLIERGALRGLVLVVENLAVRTLAFAPGSLTDRGPFELGGGLANVTGAIGVQP